MPTALTVQTDRNDFSYVAADATGNTFDNSAGDVLLYVFYNGGLFIPLSVTVTVAEQRTCNFGHPAVDLSQDVALNSLEILGPFDLLRFNNTSRLVSVTYSSVTNLSVAAVRR